MSYPYDVLEEAIVNAFYHRDYMCHEPVKIEIEPDRIQITSFPGIDRSVPLSVIEKGERFKSKMYRNRRLGEFLKELDLTEGRSTTGIPTIQEGLLKNGSPRATFETDEERRVLWVTIPIQPDYYKELGSSGTTQSTQSSQGQSKEVEDGTINDIEKEILNEIKRKNCLSGRSRTKVSISLFKNL